MRAYSARGSASGYEYDHALRRLVCNGQIQLAHAQRVIASWVAAYQRYG